MQMCQDTASTSVEGGQYDAEERRTIFDDSMVEKSSAGPAQAKTGKLGNHYTKITSVRACVCVYEREVTGSQPTLA